MTDQDPSPTIQCPSCKTQIKLNESLAAPLIAAAQRELEVEAAKREHAVKEREHALGKKLIELEAQRAGLDEEITAKLAKERQVLAAAAEKRVRAALADELAQSRSELAARDALIGERDAKLAVARAKEMELLKMQRELETQRQELELSVQRRLQEESGKLRDEARRAADEDSRLSILAKDKIISDMQAQVEEMRRKSEQGSQQLQGEVFELQLEALLRQTFPTDAIEPVPKGEHGGDVVHRVRNGAGQVAGTLLWEMKNTKAWKADWLQKLRADQRAAKADLAILVSDVLPKGIQIFGEHEGVWITSTRTALPVALCLRQLLVEVAAARKTGEGLETKMDLVYQYLTGPRFKQRVNAVFESFRTMKADLDKERQVLTKHWAKRDAQLERGLAASVGMIGDMEGISGQSMHEIEGHEWKALDAPDEDTDGSAS